ncbi:MAG: hypothetical protein LBV36_02050 [Chromatiales bacterium]|jgi:hypothetical protein|nr:hypothetical protein [Chromatiales bacterium]
MNLTHHTRLLSRAAFALLLCTAVRANADCLSVTAQSYKAEGNEMGVATVVWNAELSNSCDAAYDADLHIVFVDEHEKEIFQSRDLEKVPRHGRAIARREISIPAPDFERVRNMRVVIVAERERPL